MHAVDMQEELSSTQQLSLLQQSADWQRFQQGDLTLQPAAAAKTSLPLHPPHQRPPDQPQDQVQMLQGALPQPLGEYKLTHAAAQPEAHQATGLDAPASAVAVTATATAAGEAAPGGAAAGAVTGIAAARKSGVHVLTQRTAGALASASAGPEHSELCTVVQGDTSQVQQPLPILPGMDISAATAGQADGTSLLEAAAVTGTSQARECIQAEAAAASQAMDLSSDSQAMHMPCTLGNVLRQVNAHDGDALRTTPEQVLVQQFHEYAHHDAAGPQPHPEVAGTGPTTDASMGYVNVEPAMQPKSQVPTASACVLAPNMVHTSLGDEEELDARVLIQAYAHEPSWQFALDFNLVEEALVDSAEADMPQEHLIAFRELLDRTDPLVQALAAKLRKYDSKEPRVNIIQQTAADYYQQYAAGCSTAAGGECDALMDSCQLG